MDGILAKVKVFTALSRGAGLGWAGLACGAMEPVAASELVGQEWRTWKRREEVKVFSP